MKQSNMNRGESSNLLQYKEESTTNLI